MFDLIEYKTWLHWDRQKANSEEPNGFFLKTTKSVKTYSIRTLKDNQTFIASKLMVNQEKDYEQWSQGCAVTYLCCTQSQGLCDRLLNGSLGCYCSWWSTVEVAPEELYLPVCNYGSLKDWWREFPFVYLIKEWMSKKSSWTMFFKNTDKC